MKGRASWAVPAVSPCRERQWWDGQLPSLTEPGLGGTFPGGDGVSKSAHRDGDNP